MNKDRCLRLALILLSAAALPLRAAEAQTTLSALPQYDHIVLVIDENKNNTEIRGSALAPYINNTLLPNSADLTHFVAETHPSQPNYLHLFSGSNQGVTQDGLPGTPAEPGTLAAPPPFHTPNLGRELLNAGKTFGAFSESLPSVGYTGETYSADPGLNEYVRKHNPTVDWQDDAATAASNPNALPSSVNRSFSDFTTITGGSGGFSSLPAFSLVVPNEQNDMHDGSITQGDTWLANNIEPYRQWAQTHNSLLIFTFDESDLGMLQADPNNQIITTISGQGVVDGKYDEAAISRFRLSNAAAPDTAIDHYNLLRTIEGIDGTAHDASDVAARNSLADVQPITDIFRAGPSAAPEPAPLAALGFTACGVLGLVLKARRKARAEQTAHLNPIGSQKGSLL